MSLWPGDERRGAFMATAGTYLLVILGVRWLQELHRLALEEDLDTVSRWTRQQSPVGLAWHTMLAQEAVQVTTRARNQLQG